MTTIYLIRHAQAEGNLYRRCHSWHNGLITTAGRVQIEALERRFEGVHFDAVYSSDLYRTMTTARAIYRPRNLPLYIDPDLREIGAGVWEDVPWGQLLHDHRDSLTAFLHCDPDWQVSGSETHPQVRRRVKSAVERIAAAHPDQTVAVVSHGCAIRSGLSAWLGLGEDEISQVPLPDNTGVAKLEIADGNVHVGYCNDSTHLDPASPPTANVLYGIAGMERNALRFQPLPLPREEAQYLAVRRDSWLASHGTLDGFAGNAFLHAAEQNSAYAPDSVVLALLGSSPVGVLQMDWERDAELRVGWVPFLSLLPAFRSQRLGVQLLGHAVCTYRAMGRQYLRLACPAGDTRTEKFFLSHGFYKIGDGTGGANGLDTFEKYIGLAI